ncbi:hypothetical protein QR98_0045310 [Sarcoptes scabiei]|uniref:SHSP domain-containing protein n=1 Tax=Sarcoptes scabiei TaxID=52283 RepID=A0A132A527_SARSC|nr:hypothetical protein QR98_0045310 [Sarcoptes scabiei]
MSHQKEYEPYDPFSFGSTPEHRTLIRRIIEQDISVPTYCHDGFYFSFDVHEFKAENVKIELVGQVLKINAHLDEDYGDEQSEFRQVTREVQISPVIALEHLQALLDSNGILRFMAPLKSMQAIDPITMQRFNEYQPIEIEPLRPRFRGWEQDIAERLRLDREIVMVKIENGFYYFGCDVHHFNPNCMKVLVSGRKIEVIADQLMQSPDNYLERRSLRRIFKVPDYVRISRMKIVLDAHGILRFRIPLNQTDPRDYAAGYTTPFSNILSFPLNVEREITPEFIQQRPRLIQPQKKSRGSAAWTLRPGEADSDEEEDAFTKLRNREPIHPTQKPFTERTMDEKFSTLHRLHRIVSRDRGRGMAFKPTLEGFVPHSFSLYHQLPEECLRSPELEEKRDSMAQLKEALYILRRLEREFKELRLNPGPKIDYTIMPIEVQNSPEGLLIKQFEQEREQRLRRSAARMASGKIKNQSKISKSASFQPKSSHKSHKKSHLQTKSKSPKYYVVGGSGGYGVSEKSESPLQKISTRSYRPKRSPLVGTFSDKSFSESRRKSKEQATHTHRSWQQQQQQQQQQQSQQKNFPTFGSENPSKMMQTKAPQDPKHQ